MGAESSVLEDYDLDEPSASSKSTWTLRHGRYNAELDVTVLSEQKENGQKWSLLQKNIKVRGDLCPNTFHKAVLNPKHTLKIYFFLNMLAQSFDLATCTYYINL